MNRNHHELRQELGRPNLTPDVIDDFVSWLTSHGYNMIEFQRSETKYKRELFSRFWKQYPTEKKNYKIDFPQ